VNFDEEPEAAYRALQKYSHVYEQYFQGTRRVLLDRFPYSVVFRERLRDIQIVAIAHAKRRPAIGRKD